MTGEIKVSRIWFSSAFVIFLYVRKVFLESVAYKVVISLFCRDITLCKVGQSRIAKEIVFVKKSHISSDFRENQKTTAKVMKS